MFTTEGARKRGLTRAALRWGERNGRWRHLDRGVWGEGPEDPTSLDLAIAAVIATDGVASGRLTGVLCGLDSIELRGPDLTLPPGRSTWRPGVRRRVLPCDRMTVINGIRCTNGLQTMLDLAGCLDDATWEQALESALRKELLIVADLEEAAGVCRGTARVQRVLALRPPDALPTESLLETLMVQLSRTIPGLDPPERQVVIVNEHGQFVARVDLAWPDLGLFIELDGEHHLGQPVYDASRETAIVAATGWLPGRFTWTEVVRFPHSTARRLAALVDQARRRLPRPASQAQ